LICTYSVGFYLQTFEIKAANSYMVVSQKMTSEAVYTCPIPSHRHFWNLHHLSLYIMTE